MTDDLRIGVNGTSLPDRQTSPPRVAHRSAPGFTNAKALRGGVTGLAGSRLSGRRRAVAISGPRAHLVGGPHRPRALSGDDVEDGGGWRRNSSCRGGRATNTTGGSERPVPMLVRNEPAERPCRSADRAPAHLLDCDHCPPTGARRVPLTVEATTVVGCERRFRMDRPWRPAVHTPVAIGALHGGRASCHPS
jgi:hypothetical protein